MSGCVKYAALTIDVKVGPRSATSVPLGNPAADVVEEVLY
jgi:hypothetical protein